MEPTRIIAIRHGETDWNVATRMQGHTDIGLNAVGRSQAERMAQALAAQEQLHAIYSSDLSRARDTAAALAARTGLPLQLEPALRERAFGCMEGLTWAEVGQRWPEQAEQWRRREPGWQPQGGESLLQFQQRISTALQRLAAQYPGQQIVLVVHGGVLDVLYRAATGQDLQAPRTWKMSNCAINRLLWTPCSLTLVGWADEQHLQTSAMDETSA